MLNIIRTSWGSKYLLLKINKSRFIQKRHWSNNHRRISDYVSLNLIEYCAKIILTSHNTYWKIDVNMQIFSKTYCFEIVMYDKNKWNFGFYKLFDVRKDKKPSFWIKLDFNRVARSFIDLLGTRKPRLIHFTKNRPKSWIFNKKEILKQYEKWGKRNV